MNGRGSSVLGKDYIVGKLSCVCVCVCVCVQKRDALISNQEAEYTNI